MMKAKIISNKPNLPKYYYTKIIITKVVLYQNNNNYVPNQITIIQKQTIYKKKNN